MIWKTIILCSIVTLFSTLLFTGCSQEKAGAPIPSNLKAIEISKLKAETDKFLDKKILLAGNFGGICGTGCCKEFIIRQGIESIKVDPVGIKVPNFDMGLPVKVYGILKKTKSSPYVVVLGVDGTK